MKRFVGFLSLMVLLLNSVLMPLTYAQEYQDEILGTQVNNTVGDSSNVENVSETEGEQNEGAEDASQFPVIEENPQESEITPVDESQDEDQEIPSESTLSGGLEGSENTNQEGANGVGSGNDLGETLGSGDDENLNVQSGANQIDDTLSGVLIQEQLASSGDVVSQDTGSGSVENLDEDSGILSSVVEAIEGIFNSIRYFFVKDNSEYIREYKQNGVKVISLKDPVNGETITIMDRNLGAEDNDITSKDSYGNYYQWGNNNGFEKVDGGNVTSNLAVYSLKYEGIGYTRDNKFRVGSNDIWKLDEEGRSNYDELWYLGEDEEIQGPCPEGYHVPSDKEWNKLVRVWTKIHTVDEKEGGKTVRSVKGDTLKASLEQAGTGDAEENTIEEENLTEVEELFMKELKLPKAGNYATNGERQEGLGIYWTRTPSDKSYQSEVFSIERYFGEDFNDELLNRANGNSVRCFLDTKDKEVVEYNKEEITGEETYDGVTVSVYAGTGFFPEGTKLLISPIVQEQEVSDIKDKISEEDDNIIEDSKLVAFDISFIYRGEEVQPLEGKVVKVTFDYSNNDELSEADKIDEQEVKIFHIDDKDEEGNKVEKGEEVVKDVTNIVESEENGIAVADAESFSVYVLVSSSSLLEPFTVTYNLNGGYWTEEGEASTGNKDITYEYDSTVTLVSGKKYYKPTSTYKTPSKAGNTCNGKKCMFKGWYTDIGGNNRWNGTVSSDMTVYAKWLPFDDLHVYFLVDHDNIIHETIMDRNLGATEIYSQDYSHQNVAARGDYFQWGNNYAFGTSINGLEQIPEKTRVPASVWELGVPSKYYSSIFYTKDKETWTIGNSKLLWGGDGDTDSSIGEGTTYTGRQGPCPDGYHIPSAMSRRQLFNNWNLAYNYDYSSVMNISSNNNNPIIVGVRNGLGKDLLLPPAGRWGGTALSNTDKDLSYWASSHNESDSKTAYGFFVGQFGVQPRGVQSVGGGGDGESRGRSIRCFKNPENESSYLSLSNIHLNGGEKGIISIIDGKIAALKEPSRGDDEFRGWYTTSGYDEGTKIGVGSGLQQGDRLYAKWCAEGLIDDGSQCVNGYTITFDTDGGTNVPSQNVDLGGTGTRPTNPTKDGYSFLGWYLTGSQTEFNFNDVLTSNITLYAKWSLVEYNIKYILNSGFVLETNPTTYTIESGDVTLNNPIRVGYDFLGWSGTNLPECSVENHSICSVSVNIQHGSTGNRVYEAIWDIEKHNLYFDSLGGSEVPTQRVIYGEAGTKPANPTKDGYSFDGWYYTGLQIEFDFNTPITSDITIYAKWSLVEYNIKYILNSGFVSQTNPTTYTTESGDITLNNPTREWYVFEGWSGTNLPECSMEDTSTCSKTVTISYGSIGDRTYEAIWGYVKHDLSFDSLGGSEVQTQKVIHGRTGTKPKDPTRDGYTFVGWYLTGLQTEFNFTGTTINSDITVYAKWSLVDYTITYHLNGGTGLVNTGIYTKETETFTLNNPTKLNYDFIGWSGTNLSLCSVDNQTTCNKVVTIEQGSTGDRVYEAIYDCAYGKKLDGTCNIVRGEDGLIDYTNWEYNDLEVDLSVTDPVKIVIMDRNLGAAISDLDSTDAFGFYYQWGNNYGFRNVGTIENVSDEQVDASAYGPGNYYVSDTFIKQSSLGWDNPSNNNLWGGAGDRLYVRGSGSDGDRQGPCPTGYHVPSILEWNKIYSLAEEWKKTEDSTIVCDGFLSKEHCVASKLKLPKAGNIKGDSGTFEAGGAPGETFGRYWSSSRFDDNRAYRYRVNVEWNIYQGRYDQDYYYFNSNGMSVRCFKNVSSKPIVYELSGGVQTSNQTSTVVWWNESAGKSLTIPTKTGFVFEGWYLTSGYEEGTRVTKNVISDYSDNDTVTLYAKWRDTREVKVTYDVNGGYFPGDNDKTKERVYEESEASSGYYIIGTTDWKTPSKAGFMFDGWYLTGLTTRWTGYLENDVTVYANWLPFEDYDVKLSDDITITIMDRNLGAKLSGTGCSSTDLSTCGYHFQWGNNYGFAHSGNSKLFPNGEGNTNVQATDWSDSVSTYFKSIWIARTQWYTPMGLTDNLWGGVDSINTDDNVRQGPCPDGYHVPTTNEWEKIGNITSISSGSELRDILKLPYAGSRSDTAYTVGNLGSYGRYQSSTPSRHGNAGIFSSSILAFSDDSLYWAISSLTNRGAGLSVRCFKNTEKRALSFESKGGTEIASTQTVRWWETISSLPTPTRSNSIFSGWYTTSGYDEGTKVTTNYIGTGSGPVTLYAKWKCNEGFVEADNGNACIKKIHTVTISSNNEAYGSVTSGSVVAQEGVAITTSGNELTIGDVKVLARVKLSTPQYTYLFSGWNNTCGDELTSNCSIVAEFTRNINSYTITFHSNGGSSVDPQTKEYGTTGDKPENPIRDGYDFNGWYSNSGLTIEYHFTEVIEGNVDLYAKWTPITYAITYEYNNGTGSNPETYQIVTPEFTLNNPTRVGYTFIGWSGTSLVGSGNKTVTIAVGSTGNREYEANWQANKYQVTYKANGGEGEDIIDEAIYDEHYEFLSNSFEKTGYRFVEWNTKADGSGSGFVEGFSGIWKTITGVNLYAIWSENTYDVAFVGGDGAIGTKAGFTTSYTNTFELADNEGSFIKTGYTFSGWTYDGNHYAAGTELSRLATENGVTVTFTAEWIAETYTVTFDGNEGEVVGDNSKDVTYDGEYGELPTATRLGYTFTGWYTDATAGEKVESDTIVATASDHRLYAHWDENSYNVVYEGGEGTEGVVTGATYGYTESFNLATNNFTKRGYSFSGWMNGDNHYAAGTELSKLAAEDGATVTFTAEWNSVPYNITYELNGGVFSGVVNPTTYTVESDKITVKNPERVGYIFLGWTGTDLSGLTNKVVITGGSIGDRTYYANWQARDDIKITINHYLQDLDVDNNTVLDTYSISGTIEEEGTADSIVDISDYQQSIAGYSYGSGKVDGSVVSTTTVSPDGSRVIDLFYTRNSYSYTIITLEGSSTEGSSLDGNYYYGAKVILSGDSNNDCFVWSGWDIQGVTLENNMKQTSFNMPANEVTVTSLVTEKTYNIVFNGNGNDSGTMLSLNGIKCRQEFALPFNSFVKTGHTFTGWTTTPNGEKEFGNGAVIKKLTTGENVTIELIAIWDKNRYPVVWKDYNGSVLYEEEVLYEETPVYHGEAPSRAADQQYTYSFAGWTPEEHIVTGAQVYTAVYNETLNEYTVTWDVDGTRTMETYKYGETPNFTGSKHKDPDEQYEYSFAGWTPEISLVTGDITYTATYTATLRKFTVTWNNRNGQTLEVDTGVEYGTVPHYGGEIPTKPADAGHTYTFNGWIPELTGVTKDTTYVAKFSSDDNKYTITWLDEDDTILEIDTDVPYGTIPSYDKGTPVKTGDAQYSYTFSGWSPEIVPVEGDATYVATYTSEVNTYTITWKNSNGETLREDTGVVYGTTGDFGGIPTSGSSAEFDYEFIGWTPAVGAIHGDTTYTAVYKSNKRKYSVRFVNGETELQSGMVEYGVMPVYIGSTPVKTGDVQYSYNYIGWTPGISAVTGDITYEATFEEIVNMYNVTFVDDDGSSVIQPAQKYAYGTLRGNIAKPVNPDKPDNEQYTYEFAGWIPVVSKITGDVTFTATYSGTLRTYSVTWKNWNGDVLETDANVSYGTTPSYDSSEPTKPATAQYRYVFAGWDPVVSPVHGTIIYTAQFDEVPMTYTITWKNGNTVLEVDTGVVYGSIPSYDGITPTKASDPQYDYVFAGWNPSTGEVVSDQVYVADFDPIIRTYTVLWKNYDGTTLETDENVPYGSTPAYNGSTPIKNGNAQYSYTFKNWSPDIGPVHGNTEYTAIYDEIINKYVVAWDNYDGTELSSDEVEYGVLPQYTGPTPTRERTDKYSYTFSNSWFPTVTSVTTGATYTAQFTSTVNEYTITWKDGDGNTLKTEQVAYDETPEYTGATPTKTADAQYTYSFNNTWSPEVQSVTGDMTYTAQFDSTVNKYTITWIDGDDQVLKTDQVAYGETPEYTGETPTKTPTQEHTYTFKGWSPAVTSVTGPATYKAVFDGDVNEYAITWLDGDGNILKMETLEYGQMPSYSGATPTKTADAQYTYTFNGSWSPAIVSVTTGATYTAQFSSTLNKYSIVWKDGDGNTLKTDQVAYGQIPAYLGDTPTKTATAQYSYTFNNTWSPAIVSVTTGATYTAQFSSTLNKYSIVWKDGDGNTLKIEQVAYGTTPAYAGATPTKTATAQYSYTFNDTWSPEIEDVTTGATYTAQFTPVLNKYSIVWKDWNGTILKPAEELEYGTHPVYGLEDPTREGDAQYSYTFNGWNPAVQDVTGPQVYTATYLQTVNKYRIIFLNDDDSEITSKQVEYGTIVANYKPDDPTKEGYSFNGWNPNLVTVVTGATYKATYTINQYTLTPELGVGLERIEGGGTFDYGTEVVFTGYAKEGYHFEGGETVKAFTVTVGAHNATVRINAIANKYVVKFQPNEGGGTMQDQEFTYDLTGVLHANSFRRSGYTFTGWIDEFGNYYADQGKVYNLATGGVVEFTALWKVGEDKPEPVEPTTAAGGGRKIVNEDKEQEHESADTQTGGTGDIDSGSQYETGDIIPGDGSWTQEEMDAYKYAYKYHITTLAPREAAMPDDYVIRGHMAKMVVNYAVNVLGWKLPEKLPKQCKWNDGVDAWESQEIKDYAEKACALGLMGIDMNYFQPNKYVTRAQFGTIFGRLLRGKLPSTPYYAAHLAGLKERGIMTQIDHPEDRIEIRKWAWLMFMRSEKYFNIKK